MCYFFFLNRSSSLSLCMVFDSISSNINEFSQSTHLLMCLSLETLTSIIRTGLPILVELIDLVNSVITLVNSVIISNDLTQMVNFPTCIPDCDSHSPALFNLFFALLFVLQWFSLHWEILIMLLSQFPLTFHHIYNGCPVLSHWL